jgi:hypothetical protein
VCVCVCVCVYCWPVLCVCEVMGVCGMCVCVPPLEIAYIYIYLDT